MTPLLDELQRPPRISPAEWLIVAACAFLMGACR